MGPPEFTGGNPVDPITDTRALAVLQWGRRNSPAETAIAHHGADLGIRASMGPPEFTGGNRRRSGHPLRCAVMLQWGRRNSPAETSRRPEAGSSVEHASMGPPEFTGGNQRMIGGAREADPLASMGPPEFTGGNLLDHGAAPDGAGRFNGAAGIHRRKPCSAPGGSPPDCRLQWGRRNSPAETPKRAARSPPGPWTLQWGRRNSPAETAVQGGRCGGGRRASMGPPEFTGGNPTGGGT